MNTETSTADSARETPTFREAHRRRLAERFPALAGLNMAATLLWLLTLAHAGDITLAAAGATAAAQLLVLVPAAAACRHRPTAPWVLPLGVAAFAAVGLSWIGLFALSEASGIILGFILCIVYAVVAVGASWGLVPQLAFQTIVTAGWVLALPLILKRLSLTERVAVAGVGSLLALVIAEWSARSFRAEEKRRHDEARLRAELLASRNSFRALHDNARDFIWTADLRGRLTYVNPAVARLHDLPAEDLLGKTVADLLTDHPANVPREAWHPGIALIRAGERLPPMIVQVRAAAGPRWMESVVSPVRNADGEVVGLHASSRDVTERLAAEEALRVSEARYRGLVESQHEVVCRFDLEGRFTFVNDACCALYGAARDDLLGKPLWGLVHPDDTERVRAAIEHTSVSPYRGGVESRARAVAGWRWFEWDASGICDVSGTVVEIQAAGRDVTERRAAVDALRTSLDQLRASEEKLRLLAQRQVAVRDEERKRLGFDLHDDVCQELLGIGILVESVRGRLGAIPRDAASDLQRIVRYLNEVVEHVRLLARELRPMLLHDLGLEDSLRSLAAGLASSETTVRAVFPTPVPRLDEALELAVYRVAQEGLANAVRHAGARSIVLALAATDDTLTLEVRDDGCGFDAAHRRERALGLASMEERALARGGQLEVRSAPGRGTVLVLRCPLARHSPASAA